MVLHYCSLFLRIPTSFEIQEDILCKKKWKFVRVFPSYIGN